MKKRGQEEIVGFVLIFVIIAVVFVIFLSLSIRKPESVNKQNSKDILQFLESSLVYTTNCQLNAEYLSIQNLIAQCVESSQECSSGKTSCEVLKESLNSLIESSFKMGEDRPIKGYIYEVYQKNNLSSQSILNITKGGCSKELYGSTYPIPNGLKTSLTLCY